MSIRSDSPGVVARINALLKAAGREERLVRGRGYYYLRGGEADRFREQGFYGVSSFDGLRGSIVDRFAEHDLPDPFVVRTKLKLSGKMRVVDLERPVGSPPLDDEEEGS